MIFNLTKKTILRKSLITLTVVFIFGLGLLPLIIISGGYSGLIAAKFWKPLSVVSQFLVALVAIISSKQAYAMFKTQEKHKYKPVIEVIFEEDRKDYQLEPSSGIPGFLFQKPAQANCEELKCRFTIINHNSPISEVKFNIYGHRKMHANKTPPLFREDIYVCVGLSGGKKKRINRPITLYEIRQEPPNLCFVPDLVGERTNYSRYDSIHDWSLVLKYKNILGQQYFDVYKMLVGSPGLTRSMRFFGSYEGEYTVDQPGVHEFVKYKGFPNKETSLGQLK